MKYLKKFLQDFAGDQRGFSLVLVSAGIVALLGFMALVTDIGLIVANRQQLVNTMDAAALAGALELPDNPAQAIQVAQEYAKKNNFNPADLVAEISIDNSTISVSGEKDVDMVFARVLGIYSQTVSANSCATVEGMTSARGAAPLTISDEELKGVNFGDKRTLKYQKWKDGPLGPGNFGALALGDTGADTYRKNLIEGYDKTIKVGDKYDTEPGNMSGPTGGINERIARCCHGCTVNHFVTGCPRVIIVPVHQYAPGLFGRDALIIKGFAAFFVEDYNEGEVEGYFIKTVGEGEASPFQINYGLSAARLIS